MNPKDSRPGTPSLLADPAPRPAEQKVFTKAPAEPVAALDSRAGRASGRGWRLPVIGIALLAIVVATAFAYSSVFGGGRQPGHAVASVAPTTDPTTIAATADGVPAGDAAVILPDAAQDSASAVADGPLSALPAGSTPAAAASADAGGPASSSNTTLTARLRPQPVPRHARANARTRHGDSDVALLTALITHVQKGGPHAWQQAQALGPGEDLQGLEMQSCPHANTKAGLACRARICKGHVGQSPSCPAPAGKD